MPQTVRHADDRFLEDIKRILGDADGILRSPPSRAEREEAGQLSGLLWGFAGSANPGHPELASEFAGHLHTPGGQRMEVRHVSWGGQILDLLPPRRVPRCRIWLLRQEGTEYLIAMVDVEGIPRDRYPDLTGIVGPRAQDLYPGSYIEQKS